MADLEVSAACPGSSASDCLDFTFYNPASCQCENCSRCKAGFVNHLDNMHCSRICEKYLTTSTIPVTTQSDAVYSTTTRVKSMDNNLESPIDITAVILIITILIFTALLFIIVCMLVLHCKRILCRKANQMPDTENPIYQQNYHKSNAYYVKCPDGTFPKQLEPSENDEATVTLSHKYNSIISDNRRRDTERSGQTEEANQEGKNVVVLDHISDEPSGLLSNATGIKIKDLHTGDGLREIANIIKPRSPTPEVVVEDDSITNIKEVYRQANDNVTNLEETYSLLSHKVDIGEDCVDNMTTGMTETKVKQDTGHSNKSIFPILRRMPWVIGYFSKGDSIEVYLDFKEITEENAMADLIEMTGEKPEKFHLTQNMFS